jgi:hypothetical protein
MQTIEGGASQKRSSTARKLANAKASNGTLSLVALGDQESFARILAAADYLTEADLK